jgi:hypothetical protein
MNEQVIEALKGARYRVFTPGHVPQDVYRLRYRGYRAEGAIEENERGTMNDPYDDTENCVHVAVEMNGKIRASVRLHLVSRLTPISPTMEVFPEVREYLDRGRTLLDSSRLTVDPTARKHRVKLNFLIVRVPLLATIFYDVDIALVPVRAEHAAFYRRYLGAKPEIGPRSYLGLTKPLQLLTTDVRAERDGIIERTPFLGPMDNIPQSNVPFPELDGVYVASNKGRTDAA